MRTSVSYIVGVFSALMMTGCAEIYQPTPHSTAVKSGTSLSNTASLTHIMFHDNKSTYLTCAHPQPDAAFDQGEAADFSFSLLSLGGDDQGAETEKSEEVEMAGRTPALLMARELFFRACEFSHNFKLGKEEAITLYRDTLKTVGEVWAKEAGNTTVTIGDTLQTTSGVMVQSQTSGSVGPALSPQGSIQPSGAPPDAPPAPLPANPDGF